MRNKILFSFLLLSLAGCSSRGPMQSLYGPAETPGYTEIMESRLYRNKEEIDFVATAYSRVEYRGLRGAITITSESIGFAQWNIDAMSYNPVFKIPINQIEMYGRYMTLNVPVGLFTRTFYIQAENKTYYLSSEQMDSVYYYIQSINKNAIRVDK